jgi:hypothetical protein
MRLLTAMAQLDVRARRIPRSPQAIRVVTARRFSWVREQPYSLPWHALYQIPRYSACDPNHRLSWRIPVR